MSDYNRGYNDGYQAGYDAGYVNANREPVGDIDDKSIGDTAFEVLRQEALGERPDFVETAGVPR